MNDNLILYGVAELLAGLPYALGYHPAPSEVVCLGLRGTRPQGIAVIPANEIVHPERSDAFWAGIRERILNPDLGMLTRATTEIAVEDELGLPTIITFSYGAPEADRLAQTLLDLQEPDVVDVIRVHDGRWRSLLCDDPSCCPPEGNPVDPAPTAVLSLIAATGLFARASRAELESVLQPGAASLTGGVAAALERRSRTGGTDDWQAALERLEAARDQGLDLAGGVEQTADLLLAIEDFRVRDRCLDWQGERTWALWTGLIRCAPPGWTAPVATLIAVFAYRRGDRVLARAAASHALAERRDYTMAQLVRQGLLLGLSANLFGDAIDDAVRSLTYADATESLDKTTDPGVTTTALRMPEEL